jgi:hypothetical protein
VLSGVDVMQFTVPRTKPVWHIGPQVLANGATPTQVAQGFINSAEFQQVYGTLSASDFVTTLYENVLHRAGDPTGAPILDECFAAGRERGKHPRRLLR